MPSIATAIQYPPAAAVIFFADGMAQSVLHRMLAAGELPNISRLFDRGGVEVKNAVVSLPSLTYANATSLITGLFPGHHGILGNQWYDPTTFEYRDYGSPFTYRDVNEDIHHPTIYDLLNEHFTLNVQCHTRKGVKHSIDQDLSSGLLWALGKYETVDRRVGDVLPRMERVIQAEGRWPIVWMNYFPGLDEIGHRFGPDSPQYARAVRNIDQQIGRIAAFAEKKSGCEKLYMAFVTDHGMVYTAPNRRLRTITSLRMAGLRIASTFQKSSMEKYDYLALLGTDRCLRFHLRGKNGWNGPATVEDTEQFCENVKLRNLRDTQLVCRRLGDNKVEIQTFAGRAIVERKKETSTALFRYSVTSGEDPLGYRDHAEVQTAMDGWYDSQTWLAKTATTTIPDFVPQVSAMFDSPRSGDVVSFARDDWSFDPRFLAGHGSCLADDMRVSHFYAGPGLPSGGKTHTARLVDFMPTLLDFLGLEERLHSDLTLDGVSLRQRLEAACTARCP